MQEPMQEPSVLDYVKAKLMPWKGPAPQIQEFTPPTPETPASPAVSTPFRFPWRSLLALGLAFYAQWSLEPRADRTWRAGLWVYILAFLWLIWSNIQNEWKAAFKEEGEVQRDSLKLRWNCIGWIAMAIGVISGALAFLTLNHNLFTSMNVFLWLLSLAAFLIFFWVPGSRPWEWLQRLLASLKNLKLNITFTRWTLLLLAVVALVLFFRFYKLDQVPLDMTSDQAEKLLDVWDVRHEQTHIFFPRNTGREAFQFYLTSAVISIFNTGYSFLSLKIGTAICGLITLVYLYLLGKELGNRRVALIAVAFAGIAYWPNVFTRVALRFALYPLFAAPVLYYLIRGLRRSSRNDFLLAGLFLGAGLHSYSPFRIMPLVVLVAVGLYLLHRQAKGKRLQTMWMLGLLVIISVIVFLPLARYITENPANREIFMYRSFTRLTSSEHPLPGPAGEIFLKNLWKALIMFAWDDGEVWTISIPHRPALDVISAALFYLGVLLIFLRYIRKQNWVHIFLILSVPLMMMPSILSLAFPNENPITNRTAGAMIPVFLIIGFALEGVMNAIQSGMKAPWGRRFAWGLVLFLVWISSTANFNLVFDRYNKVYEQAAWNTTEMGGIMRQFGDTVGDINNTWVIGYPYWVDTRLVGMASGQTLRDTFIGVEQLPSTQSALGPKLFLLNLQDQAAVEALRQLYPDGTLATHQSKLDSKNFYLYFVPPQKP
jgi:4-amino-4-deoxy-L-arabinose transferase-like glycosyltransferase